MRHAGRHTAIPGPRGYPPVGVFLQLRRDPLRYLTEAARQHGEVVSVPMGVRQAYLLAHPAHIQRVLQDQPDGYQKGAGVERIKPLFGEGLTTSEGTLWRRQSQFLRPLFQWQRLLPSVDVTVEATAALLALGALGREPPAHRPRGRAT
jgi:Cytochrome P450